MRGNKEAGIFRGSIRDKRLGVWEHACVVNPFAKINCLPRVLDSCATVQMIGGLIWWEWVLLDNMHSQSVHAQHNCSGLVFGWLA